MNTLVGRRQFDGAYAAFLLLIPVVIYWAVWAICFFMFDNNLEGDLFMRSIIPRKVLGLPVHLIIFLLTAISLFFSVSAKVRRRTRWYKTPLHIKLSMALGMFLMFLIFLQALM